MFCYFHRKAGSTCVLTNYNNCRRAMATYTDTLRHTHCMQNCIIFLLFVPSRYLLDTKAPRGRCWPCLSRITSTSVCTATTTSAESQSQECAVQSVCRKKPFQCYAPNYDSWQIWEITKGGYRTPARHLWKWDWWILFFNSVETFDNLIFLDK